MSSQPDRELQPGGGAGIASALDRWLLRTMMAALPRAGALLMRTRWFMREIVTRRWFVHEHVAPLRA